MSYDAVIFDNDGVLTEPTDRALLRSAIREAFRECGVADPPMEHVAGMLGVTTEDVERICSEHDLDAPTFWRRRETNASRVQQQAIHDGAKGLYDDVAAVETLATERGTDLAIVSNNQHETVEFIVEHFGLTRFETVYGREPSLAGIERKKPQPYYLRKAIDEIGVHDVLYVGDSNADLGAAKRLDVDVAFLRRPHRREYELAHEPTYEIESLEELHAVMDDTDTDTDDH